MKKEAIKIGDTVKVKTIEFLEDFEAMNWIEDEVFAPQVGDIFTVNDIDQGWVYLDGLQYAHPIQKFELA